MRAGSAIGSDGTREVAPHIVLGIRVTDPGQQLWMGRDDVEGLHEGLLCDFPVAAQDFRDVGLLVPPLKGPTPELIRQLWSDEVVERFGLRIGIDENEAAPGPNSSFG